MKSKKTAIVPKKDKQTGKSSEDETALRREAADLSKSMSKNAASVKRNGVKTADALALLDSVPELSSPMTRISGPAELLANAVTLKQAVVAKMQTDPDQRETATERILAEVIAGAYHDKLAAYLLSPTAEYQHDLDVVRKIQRIRQSADNHLLQVIQAAKDLRRPPINVVVKQAEQVNIGQQQQVNNDRQKKASPK